MANFIVQKSDSKGHIILRPSAIYDKKIKINSEHFEIEYWRSRDLVSGKSKGRNSTYFVEPQKNDEFNLENNNQWVLRHYYRGGLVAKLISDSYFFTGIKRTRCYRELELLQQMISLELPTPKPIAARVTRNGLFYHADLIMEKITAKDTVSILRTREITEDIWKKIGSCIALFHNHGINHVDLNAHNIMIDQEDKIWLIDFDRCQKLKIDTNWQESNIKRLHRSLEKEKSKHSNFNYSENNWLAFIDGYSAFIKR